MEGRQVPKATGAPTQREEETAAENSKSTNQSTCPLIKPRRVKLSRPSPQEGLCLHKVAYPGGSSFPKTLLLLVSLVANPETLSPTPSPSPHPNRVDTWPHPSLFLPRSSLQLAIEWLTSLCNPSATPIKTSKTFLSSGWRQVLLK